ncbi:MULTISPECIES: DUF1573 domain-containing protein [unclassified Carboxylicivirga]|uniref:DUF1573 domain-containing protein n=1 Tax=Carboxylicivirga TaxID=1628153 RepID=UPI003D351F01
MKSHHLLILFLALSCSACILGKKRQKEKIGSGKLRFTELSYNFGTLRHGDVVAHRFRVVNEGDYPVTIQEVSHQCGCTDAFFTKAPIDPADTGYVEVLFDTKGWQGRQVKQVVVMANDSVKRHELLVWASINRN